MFPHGCPSYQKAFVKLFKIEKGKYRLIDTKFFNNREGFGYIMRNLTKGEYQIHFKKYSTSFDVFDFTVKMYSNKHVKLIDDENKIITKLCKEIIPKLDTIKDYKSVQKVLNDEKLKKEKPKAKGKQNRIIKMK